MSKLLPTFVSDQRVSLCMIVRDEAANLRRCLNSCAGWVDEIIIADTGSQDESREIAKEFGAKVVDFAWCDDFAAARNFSLAQASGDWILFLDADEELVPGSGAILRRAIAKPQCECYLCQLLCLCSPNDPQTANNIQVLRLFRRRPAYRFTGRIHEQIIDAILQCHPAETVSVAPIMIKHYGYFPKERELKQKSQRNLRILQKELEESGANPELLYYIGSEYSASQDEEQALDYYFQAEAGNREPPLSQISLLITRNILLTLYSLQRYPAVIERATQALPDHPGYTDLFYIRANSRLQLNQPLRAYQDWVSCIKLGEAGGPYPSTTGFGSFLTWQQLGDYYQARGQRPQAIAAYHQSLAANPWLAQAWNQLQQLCNNSVDPYLEWQYLKFFLIDFLKLDLTARLILVECLGGWADWPWIRAFLETRETEIIPPEISGRYHFWLGCAHFFEHRPDQAQACFREIPPDEAEKYSGQINYLQTLATIITHNYHAPTAATNPENHPEDLFFYHLNQFLSEGRELPTALYSTATLSRQLITAVKYLSFLGETKLLAKLSAVIVTSAPDPLKYDTLAFLISRNHLTLANELLCIYPNLPSGSHPERVNFLQLKTALSLKNATTAERLLFLRQALEAGLQKPRFYNAITSELANRARQKMKEAQERFPEFQFLNNHVNHRRVSLS